MSTYDYTASAELFAAKGGSGLQCRRFARAAVAIRYAIEKLPPQVFSGTSLEVNDERYNATQIRALYESQRYPLSAAIPHDDVALGVRIWDRSARTSVRSVQAR